MRANLANDLDQSGQVVIPQSAVTYNNPCEIMHRNIRSAFLHFVAHKPVACIVGYTAAANGGEAEILFRTLYGLLLYLAAGFDCPD